MVGVDPLNQAYFDGVDDAELRIQQCDDCGAYQFYPRVVCKHCSGEQLSWTLASGRGQVASFTVVRRGVSAAYQAPYIVALIDLEEGVRMMSHLVDVDPEQVVTGMAVTVLFRPIGEGGTRPVFTPSTAS